MDQLSDLQITKIITILLDISGSQNQLHIVKTLSDVLQQVYLLSPSQLQQLSGAVYGKPQIFKILIKQSPEMQIISFKIVYALIQTQITCADFVLGNSQFIDDLVTILLVDFQADKIQQFTGAQGPEFGTYIDENYHLNLSDLGSKINERLDAAGAILESVARHSSQGRKVLEKRIDEILNVLVCFKTIEIFLPLRIMHILNILNYLVVFLKLGITFINDHNMLIIINQFCEKLFYNNPRSLDFLTNKAKEVFPEKSTCYIFAKDGKLVHKNDDLYTAKISLLSLAEKLYTMQ
ncbi:hypothetical protein SS50377_21280 [Spironucleus salmonicida]|uniref:Uncharacterized protein n=1 Tax=Spironucleus salmonicida TaxID=348837 RepID=V6LHL6_9EUKA|nr:hypothetical protein SS50377_21280 [Spironucleus salmonicida]|eukprot:EST44047.1 Hypothetical protein SS50377_16360 [Spironucleus salmonicida]